MSNPLGPIKLSDVAFAGPPPEMHSHHPIRNAASHGRLMDFLLPRLIHARTGRNDRLTRLVDVDKQLYGWIRLDTADQKRKNKKDDTGQPYAVPQHLPLALIHLQDAVAYYSGIFAPTRGMFQHSGDATEQEEGRTLLKLMNQHSQHAGYYRELMRAILDVHKYQMGGLITEWDVEPGLEIQRSNGQVEVRPTIAWQGNRVEAVDLYNAFWPSGVKLTDIDCKAEFFATTRLTNYYEMQKNGAAGTWLNLEESLNSDSGKTRNFSTKQKHSFFKFPPAELSLAEDSLSKREGAWSFLSTPGIGELPKEGHFELTRVWIWLNPYEHNLVARNRENRQTRNRLELWKLELIDAAWIVSAAHVPNVHARIPVAMGNIANDGLGEWQKSAAEVMKPLQDFLSFLLNTHIQGTRKNIWGLTFYNPLYVDMGQLEEGEVVGNIPVRPTGLDVPLDRLIHRPDSSVDTRQTMTDFQNLLGVVQQLMPTQALPSQIAGIDRAVDRQVAAVIQGGNRPLQMTARMLDETMLRAWRTLLYFNIIQFQTDVELIDVNGGVQKVDADKLQDVKLEYVIGQGLKALDKQTVAQELQRIVFAVLQSQQAMQQIDVVGLLDAWSDFLDVEMDLTQFRVAPPRAAQPAASAVPAASIPGGTV